MKDKISFRISKELMDYVRDQAQRENKSQTDIFEDALHLHRLVNRNKELVKALKTLESVKALG